MDDYWVAIRYSPDERPTTEQQVKLTGMMLAGEPWCAPAMLTDGSGMDMTMVVEAKSESEAVDYASKRIVNWFIDADCAAGFGKVVKVKKLAKETQQ